MKSSPVEARTSRRPPGRVLMTTDTVGGVWTYALELCRALAVVGVEVALATMGAPLTPAQAEEARGVPGLRVFESTWRLEWMESPWEDVEAAGAWLLGLEARLAPDVVHLNGYCHGALPWRAPVVMVAHSCVASWWEAVRRGPLPESWSRYRREVRGGLRAASRLVAPSAAMGAAIERHYAPGKPVAVIPNARRPESFVPGPKAPFVLAVGRLWDEAKNLAALEAAAPSLSWPVRVAGELRQPGGGSEARARHTVPLGRLSPEEVAAWMGRAAVYASPARYEPFGLSALEAGLAGCALVLGDVPSLREVWGDAALFVPPDDSRALVSTLSRLEEDVGLRERFAARARARALTYTPRRMVEAYLALYASLPRSRPARPGTGLALGAP